MGSLTTGVPPTNEAGRQALVALAPRDSETGEANRSAVLSLDQYGKPLAVAMYNAGGVSLERLQSAFDARPDWRSA